MPTRTSTLACGRCWLPTSPPDNSLVWVCELTAATATTHPGLSRAVAGDPVPPHDVYRTYVRPAGSSRRPGRGPGGAAVGRACERRPGDRPRPLRLPEGPPAAAAGRGCRIARSKGRSGPLEDDFALRFQQLSGPVMAKGNRGHDLLPVQPAGLAERGGRGPRRRGGPRSRSSTPQRPRRPSGRRPCCGTSTPDTKSQRGRPARISLLSQIPQEWATAVRRWAG